MYRYLRGPPSAFNLCGPRHEPLCFASKYYALFIYVCRPTVARVYSVAVNDSAAGIWLITPELRLTEEPTLAYHALRPRLTVDTIRL